MIAESAKIHPLALVEDGAVIGENCVIGPFSLVGPQVKLGANVELKSHAIVVGRTQMGAGCIVFPNAVLGGDPLNIHYNGEDTELIIGKKCVFREGATISIGMPDAGGQTTVGDNCMFLGNAHVGHDCHLGNNILISNNTMIAGHVEVGDNVIFSGASGVHQFARIGHHAFIGSGAATRNDVIPFGMVLGNPADLVGLNVIGLRRAGYQKSEILDIRRFVKMIFGEEGTFKERLANVDPSTLSVIVKDVYDFISTDSKRGLTLPPSGNGNQA